MSDNNTKNITIAKNSVYLFLRTFVSIVVTLFTSRIFINQLGIEDYGIYNLVGGVVSVFYMLTSFMTGATQRFLSVEIGKGDIKEMNKIMNISVTIHFFIGLSFVILGEVVGLILLKYYLNVPVGKEMLTQLVFHFALVTSVVSLISIPYNAFILAKERMSFFALITIADVVLKLLVTLALYLVNQKLIIYSVLLLFANSCITFAYYYYCKKKLELPKYTYYSYKTNSEYKELFVFSGWSFLGYFSSATREHGTSIVLNLFFGVLLNAAMGVVYQIYGVFTRLFLNLQAAFRPQVIQNAYTDRSRYDNLLNICTFYTIILIGLICTPFIIGCNTILHLWLGLVPDYAVLFVQVIMIKVFFASITQCLNIAIEAYAKLRSSMIASCIISVLVIMVSFFLLRQDFPPIYAVIMLVLSELAFLLYRLYYTATNRLINYSEWLEYNYSALILVVVSIILAFYTSKYMKNDLTTLLAMAIETIIYCVMALIIMKKNQRALLFERVKSILRI
jgi:O-antigen/teichoic acid export membrane protein